VKKAGSKKKFEKPSSNILGGKKELLPHETAGKDIKDPNNDILNADWLAWYTDIQIKMQKVVEDNKKIEDDILRRQNRYIMREQDFRLQIEEL
jgi:hypothetical protein